KNEPEKIVIAQFSQGSKNPGIQAGWPRVEYSEHRSVQLHLAIMRHEDGVEAGHDAYSRVDPEHGVLEYTVERDDGLRHLVLFLARRIDNRLRGTASGYLSVWRGTIRSEEHTSELQSRRELVCRLLLEKKKKK